VVLLRCYTTLRIGGFRDCWFDGIIIGNHSVGSGRLYVVQVSVCLLRATLLRNLRYACLLLPVVSEAW